MRLRDLISGGATLSPPKWLSDNLVYETIMGSVAYGVSNDTSDMDVYGVAIPPKEMVFPHLTGQIDGFGKQQPRFESWQEHHIEYNGKVYDFQVYGIVKFFQLAMENNPNIIDSIFTPRRCVLSSTHVGEIIRENRHKFLHKGSWHKLKAYAYSQLSKINSKKPTGNRAELVEKYGYDVKFAYHVVRLLSQAEQILDTGDLDLELNREQLKSIRRGEWTLENLNTWAQHKQASLEALLTKSDLRSHPDESEIRAVLVSCLEHHYGRLDLLVRTATEEREILRKVASLVDAYR